MPQPFKSKWKVQRWWQIWKKKECKKVDKQITERKKRGTKKCELLLLCGLLKSLRGDFRVSEDKVGRGVRSFRARRGTAHAWPSLCIPTDLIYTLFLLYLCLYSSCLSKPVIMSCRIWLTLGDMLICTFNFLCVNGNFCLCFLSHCHCAQHCSWRGFYTTCCRSLKIQTPSCRRLGKSHSRERKICPFLLRFGNTS